MLEALEAAVTFAPTPLAAVREARAWREVIAPTQQVRGVVVIVAVDRWERSRDSCSHGLLLVAGHFLIVCIGWLGDLLS